MQSQIYHYQTMVHENYLDVFGHMNNAVYLDLFEFARWDLLNRNGFDLDFIRTHKIGPVILETHIRYLKELIARDVLDIQTQMTSYKSKIGLMSQKMIKNGETACEAVFTIALLDLQKRKIISPTASWLKAIGVTSHAAEQ